MYRFRLSQLDPDIQPLHRLNQIQRETPRLLRADANYPG
jgi:hypothetical protein